MDAILPENQHLSSFSSLLRCRFLREQGLLCWNDLLEWNGLSDCFSQDHMQDIDAEPYPFQPCGI